MRLFDRGETRTPNKRIRNPWLCPVELHGHFGQGWTRTNETEVSDLQSDAIATMRPTHILPKVRFELTRLSAPHFECDEATNYSTRAIYSR